MKRGFQEREITASSADGRDDRLIDSLHFLAADGTLYRVPAGSTTDGMSTPPIVNAIPGFEPYGIHWFSAVLHDAAYRGTLERLSSLRYMPANLSRLEADELIREALATQGVGILRRSIIFRALRLFGGPNFHP